MNIGAGAGPSPFYTAGTAYLAGPYKGAPLSLAVVTPAVAGPFDLGNVVVRNALYVDPASAQVRAVSDPIPVDPRGNPARPALGRRQPRPRRPFTKNPTSCYAARVHRLDRRPDRPEHAAPQSLPGRRLRPNSASSRSWR